MRRLLLGPACLFSLSVAPTVAFWKNPDLLYEYACHEGNYALKHILETARAAEK